MELPVVNSNGDAIDTISIEDGVFDLPMNPTLVHQAMVIYQLNRRQGTHSTRTRAEVSGGGRKPWIQKHTGRARQGSIRAPQWRHGGVAFGPKPRSYRKALPRAMRRKALQCVLSQKIREGSLVCIDTLDGLDGRTKSMKALLERLNITGSTLVVTGEAQPNVARAGGNLKQVWTLPADLVNANDALKRSVVLITVDGIRRIARLCAAPRHRARRAAAGAAVATATTNDAATANDAAVATAAVDVSANAAVAVTANEDNGSNGEGA